MFVSENLTVNENNHLAIGGYDTVKLAQEFGTPLYVLDEDLFRKNCRVYKDAIDRYYNGNGLVLYANKSLCTLHTFKVTMEEGLGADVVSGGELYTAIKAGFPMDKVYFHGNNKTNDELEMAVSNGVGHIIVDNIYELERLNEIAKKHGVVQNIMFRIKPGVDAHTHDFIQTGQIDSKFGVALENGEAFEVYEIAHKMSNVNPDGLHCHIGSQIFDVDPFCKAAEIMMDFAGELKEKLGLEIKKLNLGGGFGIRYVESDDPVPYDEYIKHVSEIVKVSAKKHGLEVPFILMEPGRSISAPAGITLYTVGAVKDIKDVRKYVSIDGGIGDNPRYIMYEAEYTAVVANKAGDAKTDVVTIAGKCCESGDLIIENAPIQPTESGDIIAILASGAYNYSMSSNYNRIPRPAMVAVSGGTAKVIVKRETYEDVLKNDII